MIVMTVLVNCNNSNIIWNNNCARSGLVIVIGGGECGGVIHALLECVGPRWNETAFVGPRKFPRSPTTVRQNGHILENFAVLYVPKLVSFTYVLCELRQVCGFKWASFLSCFRGTNRFCQLNTGIIYTRKLTCPILKMRNFHIILQCSATRREIEGPVLLTNVYTT